METQKFRFFLVFSLCLVGFFLFDAWQSKHNPVSVPQTPAVGESDLPSVPVSQGTQADASANLPETPLTVSQQNLISIKTDLFDIKLDTVGGDLVALQLNRYPKTLNSQEGYPLLMSTRDEQYIVQSGLIGNGGPDSRESGRGKYHALETSYELQAGEKTKQVDLVYQTAFGVKITKRFTFERGSYIIKQSFIIDNQSTVPYAARPYARVKRSKPTDESGFLGMRSFVGGAVNTEDKPFKKLSFSDMTKKPFHESRKGGWAAMLDQYFITAWVPNPNEAHYYQTEAFQNDVYGIGFVSPEEIVQPKHTQTITSQLYVGPEDSEALGTLSPGLELTVDYGILWPICQPIFWVLKKIHAFVGNWGVSIILITLLIKTLFFNLSAASYRSMARMRKLQPRIELLKERYGDDKQKLGQAMMGLYKEEKINPLGGCLPIVIQIPVFIALYYVLLGSVELRQAPFAFWIHDLSAKDPYFILPLLMGASMLIQQKLNPAPPDPVQAKVMMAMPIVFTVLFLQFPSGLVLYWVVNNVLSITQQWVITKRIEKGNDKKLTTKKG